MDFDWKDDEASQLLWGLLAVPVITCGSLDIRMLLRSGQDLDLLQALPEMP